MCNNDDEIVDELLEYEATGHMSLHLFITLNIMPLERKKQLYRNLEIARMLTKHVPDDPDDDELM